MMCLLGVVAFAASAATATAAPVFGYGDQRPDMFGDPRWQQLPLKEVRRLVDWDTPGDAAKVAALDTWMSAANVAGARPLLAIDRSWTAADGTRAKPTPAQYRELITWLRGRYPWWKMLTPWNEANFRLQPTYKDPRRALQYWTIAKRACRGCTITSPVVLAGIGTNGKWLPQFLKLAKGKVKLWAVHVYGDQNRFTDKSLRRLEAQLPGQLWVTEVAGWVKFLDGTKWPHNEARAAKAIDSVFATAPRHPRVKRWYFYQWYGNADPSHRWDSGVLNADGSERFGYDALVKGLAGSGKRKGAKRHRT